MQPLPSAVLPDGVRARVLPGINGLDVHVLEAGYETLGRPAVLLLHGFPEIAYSWRKVMPALAEAGYHVIAPDQRGYGRTTGWDASFDGDLGSYRVLNLVRDVMGLLSALDLPAVAAVVGHDFGVTPAAYAALLRPDIFKSMVLMSGPFAGAPPLGQKVRGPDIHAALAALPRRRKHYQWYYSTREANNDMWHAPQGVHDFLRAYYHYKSADWAPNRPYPLAGWIASELAKMPTYYIMDLDQGMAETVAPFMPARAPAWLTDEELAVYAEAFERNGFQGGLQWYRAATSQQYSAELVASTAGKKIGIPSLYIAGASDWGVYQKPGEFERMQSEVCTDFRGAHLVAGAGHWVQQEQPEKTAALLLGFLSA